MSRCNIWLYCRSKGRVGVVYVYIYMYKLRFITRRIEVIGVLQKLHLHVNIQKNMRASESFFLLLLLLFFSFWTWQRFKVLIVCCTFLFLLLLLFECVSVLLHVTIEHSERWLTEKKKNKKNNFFWQSFSCDYNEILNLQMNTFWILFFLSRVIFFYSSLE